MRDTYEYIKRSLGVITSARARARRGADGSLIRAVVMANEISPEKTKNNRFVFFFFAVIHVMFYATDIHLLYPVLEEFSQLIFVLKTRRKFFFFFN